MKNALYSCVLGLLAMGSFTMASAEDSSGSVEKAIAALENQWSQGEMENNVDLIAPLIDDRLVMTESDGQMVDRKAFLAEEKSLKYSSSVVKDLKVTVFGDTAIANYILDQTYTSKGKMVENHMRETDTWVKSSGTWKVVASHASKIRKK